MPVHHNGRAEAYLSPSQPTPLYGAIWLSGSGSRDDPKLMVYVHTFVDFNASPQVLGMAIPTSPTGMLHLKRFSVYYQGAAGGVFLNPYAALRVGAGYVPLALGDTRVTAMAASCIDWDCNFVAGLAPLSEGSIDMANPFYLAVTGYAATDDMTIYVYFELYDTEWG